MLHIISLQNRDSGKKTKLLNYFIMNSSGVSFFFAHIFFFADKVPPIQDAERTKTVKNRNCSRYSIEQYSD